MPSKKQRAKKRRDAQLAQQREQAREQAEVVAANYAGQCKAFSLDLAAEMGGQFAGCYRRVVDKAAYVRALQTAAPADVGVAAYRAAVRLLDGDALSEVLCMPADAPVLERMRAEGVEFHPMVMCSVVKPVRQSVGEDVYIRYFAVLLARCYRPKGNYDFGDFGNDVAYMHSIAEYKDAMLFVHFSEGAVSVLPYECFLKNTWFEVKSTFVAEVRDTQGGVVPWPTVRRLCTAAACTKRGGVHVDDAVEPEAQLSAA